MEINWVNENEGMPNILEWVCVAVKNSNEHIISTYGYYDGCKWHLFSHFTGNRWVTPNIVAWHSVLSIDSV